MDTYTSDIKQPFNLIQKMLEDLTENEITLNDFIEGVDVNGATCVDINTQRRNEELDFDVVIIDDCLSHCIGGHKHISPTVKKEVHTEAL